MGRWILLVVGWVVVLTQGTALAQTDLATRALRTEGFARFDAGDYTTAIPLLDQYVRAASRDYDAQVRLGWAYYRTGRFDAAARTFGAVLEKKGDHSDALVGAGYSALRLNLPDAAAKYFHDAIQKSPEYVDALKGLILAARRTSSPQYRREALQAGSALARLAPIDEDLARALLSFGEPSRRFRETPLESDLVVRARTERDYLEIRTGAGRWQPIFIKGFNIGAALPGHFPTEFPTDEATYREWLRTIASFGANTVRLYTLLPPEFYHALIAHNSVPGQRPLWLIQGVWTELPPNYNFLDSRYLDDFKGEIARVIDAIHGNVEIRERPGHASGVYRTDASAWVLAYVIGREWEPFAVKHYNQTRRFENSWEGKWFRVRQGHAMECWVARVCDFAAEHESSLYKQLHPLTFANWPPLDPLNHPTESTRAQEDAWRRKFGITYPEKLAEEPWEDDAVSLDATRVLPTERMTAGFFAAYHIYPNFPDFMNLEPAYASGRDFAGPSRYAAYLHALKQYHREQPVLVAEFGISTSRGIAHMQSQGWHHGGLDERTQGELVARMLRNIRDERFAGGIVFEFMDEWFKGTWSVAQFEIPPERRRLWLNLESPEQSYGVIANRPAGASIRLDGAADDWRGIEPLMKNTLAAFRSWGSLREVLATSDEAFFYLLIKTGGGATPLDWKKISFRIAIDTYAPDRGERVLPGNVKIATGAEFLVTLAGPGQSRIEVTPDYDPYKLDIHTPLASPLNGARRFIPMMFESNRERFGRDGTRFPAVVIERGLLRYGSLDRHSPLFDRRSDVSVGLVSGAIELRIPWGLLNVSDPSSLTVLHQEGQATTTRTPGFRLYLLALTNGKVTSRLPRENETAPLYSWKKWETPKYRMELKDGAATIRGAMQSLPDVPSMSKAK